MDSDSTKLLAETITALQTGVEAMDLREYVARTYSLLKSCAKNILRTPRSTVALSVLDQALVDLLDDSQLKVEGDAHAFALILRKVRHCIVDRWRRDQAQRRGGDRLIVSLDPGRDVATSGHSEAYDILALNEALETLKEQDATDRVWRVVELKWFAGLTNAETAEMLGVSEATVERDWRFAKAILRKEVGDDA